MRRLPFRSVRYTSHTADPVSGGNAFRTRTCSALYADEAPTSRTAQRWTPYGRHVPVTIPYAVVRTVCWHRFGKAATTNEGDFD